VLGRGIRTIRPQIASTGSIVNTVVQHHITQVFFYGGVRNRKGDLVSAQKISRPPVCAGKKEFVFPIRSKIENSAMFKEPVYNADDPNVLA
jgi:hypothetical protein